MRTEFSPLPGQLGTGQRLIPTSTSLGACTASAFVSFSVWRRATWILRLGSEPPNTLKTKKRGVVAMKGTSVSRGISALSVQVR